MSSLVRHGEAIWSAAFPLRFMGIQVGTRSTIVRLESGGLALISPGTFSSAQLDAIRALGEVEAIVAHGEVLETGGREAFALAFREVLQLNAKPGAPS